MTAFLFPGQGSQQPGMLGFPGLCRETLAEAERFLASRPDLPSFAELDSADGLTRTDNAQLALLVVGTAAARALTRGWGVADPDVVAGHSVGAFAAAVIAGALSFGEALHAVALRGAAMKRVCAGGRWGMAAVVGVDARTARELTHQVGTVEDPLWLANINSRQQVVFSGSLDALRSLAPAAERAGATRVEPLAVAIASHCPLLEPVREALADHLAAIPGRQLRAAYLTNTRGRRTRSSRDVLADLAESVAQPVQWRTIAELLPELGVAQVVETPPGHVLARLTEGDGVQAIAVADLGLDATAQRLNRHRK